MSLPVLTLLVGIFFVLSITGSQVFAQVETSEQITLSGDLENDPVAQDILKKIEQTKKWIAELEHREYQKIQAQNFLDERRAIALESLNNDLEAWQDLWANYTSKNSFERFVNKKPGFVQDVFWDQFEFKEMKVNAGRAALKQVIADGGSLKEAREAYLKAAETKRIELIEANAQFNVKHKLAYYSQQILFDVQGKFVNSTENINQLNQYYTDFKASPAYLSANPNDVRSYEELGNTNQNTNCREGYVVVHRFHANDFACITKSTAELWINRGMGEVADSEYSAYPDKEKFGTPEYIRAEIEKRDLKELVYSINKGFADLIDEIEGEKLELIKKYKIMYHLEEQKSRDEEKRIINENHDKISAKELSELIVAIREKYKDSMEQILDDKLHALLELEKKLDEHGLEIKQMYENRNDISIIWDSDVNSYRAVLNS